MRAASGACCERRSLCVAALQVMHGRRILCGAARAASCVEQREPHLVWSSASRSIGHSAAMPTARMSRLARRLRPAQDQLLHPGAPVWSGCAACPWVLAAAQMSPTKLAQCTNCWLRHTYSCHALLQTCSFFLCQAPGPCIRGSWPMRNTRKEAYTTTVCRRMPVHATATQPLFLHRPRALAQLCKWPPSLQHGQSMRSSCAVRSWLVQDVNARNTTALALLAYSKGSTTVP